MTRLAKFVVAVALLVGFANPAMANPWHNGPKCHPRSNFGQYNYRPSVYGFNGYGASYINATPGYSAFRVPNYGFGYNNFNSFNYGGNYGAVFANPQSFGFGPYNW